MHARSVAASDNTNVATTKQVVKSAEARNNSITSSNVTLLSHSKLYSATPWELDLEHGLNKHKFLHTHVQAINTLYTKGDYNPIWSLFNSLKQNGIVPPLHVFYQVMYSIVHRSFDNGDVEYKVFQLLSVYEFIVLKQKLKPTDDIYNIFIKGLLQNCTATSHTTAVQSFYNIAIELLQHLHSVDSRCRSIVDAELLHLLLNACVEYPASVPVSFLQKLVSSQFPVNNIPMDHINLLIVYCFKSNDTHALLAYYNRYYKDSQNVPADIKSIILSICIAENMDHPVPQEKLLTQYLVAMSALNENIFCTQMWPQYKDSVEMDYASILTILNNLHIENWGVVKSAFWKAPKPTQLKERHVLDSVLNKMLNAPDFFVKFIYDTNGAKELVFNVYDNTYPIIFQKLWHINKPYLLFQFINVHGLRMLASSKTAVQYLKLVITTFHDNIAVLNSLVFSGSLFMNFCNEIIDFNDVENALPTRDLLNLVFDKIDLNVLLHTPTIYYSKIFQLYSILVTKFIDSSNVYSCNELMGLKSKINKQLETVLIAFFSKPAQRCPLSEFVYKSLSMVEFGSTKIIKYVPMTFASNDKFVVPAKDKAYRCSCNTN